MKNFVLISEELLARHQWVLWKLFKPPGPEVPMQVLKPIQVSKSRNELPDLVFVKPTADFLGLCTHMVCTLHNSEEVPNLKQVRNAALVSEEFSTELDIPVFRRLAVPVLLLTAVLTCIAAAENFI